jgi:hypothetical protein
MQDCFPEYVEHAARNASGSPNVITRMSGLGASCPFPCSRVRVAYLNQHRTFSRSAGNRPKCPKCMDRLLFTTEFVRSEVADMYPAC